MCKKAYKKAWESCRADPTKIPIAVDVDCSPQFATFGINQARTVTRSRGEEGGPWISSRGRRTTITELMALQGLQYEDIPYFELDLSNRQVGGMVGNAVAVNVIGNILSEALSSAGLTLEKKNFPQ